VTNSQVGSVYYRPLF